MTSILASFHRTLHPCSLVRLSLQTSSAWRVCAIHTTSAALKRKQQTTVSTSEADDLFGDFMAGPVSLSSDIFPASKPSASPLPSQPLPHNLAARRHDRNARFDDIYQFARACLVTKAETKRQVRSSIWIHLFQLASTPEQLDRVAGMFPKWRDAQRTFRPSAVAAFAVRCNALRCPGLALKVFSNRPKYGLDLSLEAAQIVLHSLHRWQHHKDIITFTALLSVYKLPPVSSDLLTNALLLKALLRKPTKESTAMAHAMVPSLQHALEKTAPKPMAFRGNDRRLSKTKKTWLAFALKRIEDALGEQGLEHGWLTQWMKTSGYTSATA